MSTYNMNWYENAQNKIKCFSINLKLQNPRNYHLYYSNISDIGDT